MMNLLRRLGRRARLLLSRDRVERELTDELRHHIELEAEELVRDGWTPATARREALRRFGGEESTKERVRDARGGRLLLDVIQDFRYAIRSFRRAPGFTWTTVLTLAMCIGATVAVSSVVESVVLRPLPFDEPDRLVTLYKSYPAAGNNRGSVSPYDLMLLREGVDAIEDVALYQGLDLTVGEPGETEMVPTLRATPALLSVLGVEPSIGRGFPSLESGEATQEEVLLTEEFWRTRYAADANIVGRSIRVNGIPRTVVGVLPQGFRFPMDPDARIVLPAVPAPEELAISVWHRNSFEMIGRLSPGVTVEQANLQIASVNAAAMEESPERQLLQDQGFRTVVVSAKDDLVRDVRAALYLLWAGVGLVLLLGCVNTVNLLLARSEVRLREIATRAALGATGGRLTRQMLTESAMIGLAGTAGGVILGAPGFGLFDGVLGVLGIEQLPRSTEIGLGGYLLVAIPVLALGLSLVVGILPAVHVLRRGWIGAVRTASRGGTSGRSGVRLRSALVLGQVAIAFLLVTSSGLLLRSFQEASRVDPGFDPEGVLTASLSLPEVGYPTDQARVAFTDRLLDEVRRIPGVSAVGVTSLLPFTGRNSSISIRVENREPVAGESVIAPFFNRVSPGYFRSMEIDIFEGRGFETSDGPEAPNVIVIDEELANRYWPDGGAIGQRMIWGVSSGQPVEDENLHTIVGVTETVKRNDLTANETAGTGAYYFTYRQHPSGFLTLSVRTPMALQALTAELRRVVTELDPEIPLFDVQTMGARMGASLVTRRATMVILTTFATIALLLAAVGLYGVLSFSIMQRTREIGIRMALGGTSAGVLRLVLAGGIGIVAIGMVVGLTASWALARVLQVFLFQVEAADPATYAVTALVIALVGSAACFLPARRATRVAPVEALAEGGT